MDPSSELLSPDVCLNIHTRVSNQYTKMNVFQAELFLNSSSSMWEPPVFLLLLLSMTSLLLSHSTSNLWGTHTAIEIYLTSYYLHCYQLVTSQYHPSHGLLKWLPSCLLDSVFVNSSMPIFQFILDTEIELVSLKYKLYHIAFFLIHLL